MADGAVARSRRARDPAEGAGACLILGSGPMASKLIEEIESAERPRYVVAGIVDDEQPDADVAAARAAGSAPCDQLAEIVERVQPARIVVAVADRRDRLPLQSLLESRVRGIVVEDALEFYERLTGKMAIEALRPSVLILSKGFRNHGARRNHRARRQHGRGRHRPRAVGAAARWRSRSRSSSTRAAPCSSSSSAPAANGRPFGLLKFRTMHPCDRAAVGMGARQRRIASRASADGCAGSASTSCRSWSTCCAAR